MPPPVPTPITRINSFTTWQTDHPNSPLPGDWVDEDVDQSNTGINLVAERLALIQRDDGALLNEIVTPDSLHPDVLALLEDAQNTATAAAIAAAADAATAADDAAASAASAAQSAIDAAASEQFALNAAAYEQGAIDAQTAAEAAATAAAGSAAQMPGPPLTAGKGLIVNPGATAYVLQDVMTDTGDGTWNGAGKIVKSIADAVNPTDATSLSQVQALIAGGGSVPPPVGGDVDKVLTATGASAFAWLAMTVARVSDMTAYFKGLATTINDAAGFRAAIGAASAARQIIAGTGLTGGGDLTADRTLSIPNQAGVTPGVYGPATATVNAQGIITSISTTTINEVPNPANPADDGKVLTANAGVYAWAAFLVSMISDATAYMKGLLTTINDAAGFRVAIGATPLTRTITAGVNLSGGGSLAADRTIDHETSGVGAGSYVNANITVDAQGHVTAAASGPGGTAATQAEMEAAASLTVFATPGNLHWHPGMPKALAWFDGSATGTNPPLGGYGVTSVQRTAAGSYTVTLSTAMASTNYGVLCTSQGSGATHDPTTKTTTTFRIFNVNAAGAFADTSLYTVAVYGDLP